MPQIMTSVKRYVYDRIATVQEQEDRRSISETAAFLLRVGLQLYESRQKPLKELIKEVKAYERDKGYLDSSDRGNLPADQSDLRGGAPQTGGGREEARALGTDGAATAAGTPVRRYQKRGK